ncbi:MAG: DUF2851 family protein [Calditrichaeota bacterium]|nr:MAG: DUF2851 family protein [Calditrichota bacterium]
MKNQSSTSNQVIPEYWLYWTYQEGLFRHPLYTINGEAVTIISPGERNPSDGPDFLNALIEIRNTRIRGDVEFHLSPEDWYRHGHDEDPRYQSVILHIIWEQHHPIQPALLQRFPHICLKPQLNLPFSLWRQRMLAREQDHQIPDAPPPGSLTPEVLSTLAEERFQRKVERFRRWTSFFSFEDTFYIALAEALGYRYNQAPFRQLLWECPSSTIERLFQGIHRSPLAIWVFLCYRAGLLPDHCSAKDSRQNDSLFQQASNLRISFQELGYLPLLSLQNWHFSRVRPSNHPVVRLAGLSEILYHYHGTPLFRHFLQSAKERRPLKEVLIRWGELLHLPVSPTLRKALKTIHRLSISTVYAVGETRIRQFIINAVLPLLWHWGHQSENWGFCTYLEDLYESFPSCEEPSLFSVSDPALSRRLKHSAYFQQGFLEWRARMSTPSHNLFTSGIC